MTDVHKGKKKKKKKKEEKKNKNLATVKSKVASFLRYKSTIVLASASVVGHEMLQ